MSHSSRWHLGKWEERKERTLEGGEEEEKGGEEGGGARNEAQFHS